MKDVKLQPVVSLCSLVFTQNGFVVTMNDYHKQTVKTRMLQLKKVPMEQNEIHDAMKEAKEKSGSRLEWGRLEEKCLQSFVCHYGVPNDMQSSFPVCRGIQKKNIMEKWILPRKP